MLNFTLQSSIELSLESVMKKEKKLSELFQWAGFQFENIKL